MSRDFGKLMAGSPVDPDHQVTLENWTEAPFSRWSFRNLRRLLPTADISRGDGETSPLMTDAKPVGELRFTAHDGRETTVAAMIDRSDTDGLLILYRNTILLEELRNGFTHDSEHVAFSLTKSIIGMLAGIFIEAGLVRHEDTIADIVPELAPSGWSDATVGHVLDMTTAVDFVEDYEDRTAGVWTLRRILYRLADGDDGRRIRGIHDYLPTVGGTGRHGDLFTYKSADTLVLAWVLEKVTGRQLPELIESEIWSKLGADRNAHIILDAKGVAYGAGGMSATLRDFARFGAMVANGGAWNGMQIVPENWVQTCRTGDKVAFRQSVLASRLPNGAYRNQWWLRDADRGILMAIGIHGQMIYIDRDREMVAVKLSAWPTARQLDVLADTVSAFDVIARNL